MLQQLMVVGDGPVARALVDLCRVVELPVRVQAPGLADAWNDPCVEVCDAPYEQLEPADAGAVVVAAPHAYSEQLVAAALRAQLPFIAMVASRRRAAGVVSRLEGDFDRARLAEVRSPAGLDLGAETPAEIALSALCEWLAWERDTSADRLDMEAASTPAPAPPVTQGSVELVVLGNSRIGEALARLAACLCWPTTVHASEQADRTLSGYPSATRFSLDDPDFAGQSLPPRTAVVVVHDEDAERSIGAALRGDAAYIGLSANGRVPTPLGPRLPADLPGRDRLRAPAGLDLGAITPGEIALGVAAEILTILRGRGGRPLYQLDDLPEGRPRGPRCEGEGP